MEALRDIAQRTDAAVSAARAELVSAIRAASRSGMTQSQIAREIGRSQPEVNRLLRFHGTSPLGMRLRERTSEVRQELADAGGFNVRVFGSVSRGEDDAESDIDLLVHLTEPMGLMQLSALERRLSEILDATVDLIPDSSIRPDLREEILESAVHL